MTETVAEVVAALDDLFQRIAAQGPLWTDHDPQWPSPCEVGTADADDRVQWQPVQRDAFDILEPLAETLETTLHPALSSYYGRYFFDAVDVIAPRGPVSLIGVWNFDDEQRLLQNLLGHALQQRRQRQRDTLFFACTTADSDLILTVANDTGEVLLERPGTGRHEVLAPDLASFLAELQPVGP